MRARGVPGGALAVVKDRRLVYAKGYGWADRDAMAPVRPDSLFRVASISKPITGVAVMKLVEDGKLSLDHRAFDLVKTEAILEPGKSPDARLAAITIRQLLQHTGGWDRSKSGDPMFRSVRIAEAAGVPPPAGPEEVIRYMLGQPLDFDPGTKHAYSNFGYCVLGRIIEKVTGKPYEEYVRKAILAPAGVRRMPIGRSLEKRRAKQEVRYYTADDRKGKCVFPEPEGDVSAPYGTFNLEAMDAHGGWLASAVDLARFAAALEDPDRCPLRRPATLREMYAPPPPPVARREDGKPAATHYACGWNVRPIGDAGKANY